MDRLRRDMIRLRKRGMERNSKKDGKIRCGERALMVRQSKSVVFGDFLSRLIYFIVGKFKAFLFLF